MAPMKRTTPFARLPVYRFAPLPDRLRLPSLRTLDLNSVVVSATPEKLKRQTEKLVALCNAIAQCLAAHIHTVHTAHGGG